jgi:23S rRNA (uracil1939-C5)-methyltransferase
LVQRGLEYQIEITDLTHTGAGVGRIDDLAVFVPGALPGELALAKITEVKKRYAHGELISIEKPSSHRIEPPCPVYETCGGCQLQHLSYGGQLAWKRDMVQNTLRRIGGLDVPVEPIIGMESPIHYRNKVQVPVGRQGGELAIGCYARGSHQIVDCHRCLIQDETNNKIIAAIRDLIEKYKIEVYDERHHRGDLRHIVARTIEDQAQVVLVTRQREVPRLQELAAELGGMVPEVKGVGQNINPDVTNVIMGPKTFHLWGEEHLHISFGSLKLRVSPQAFLQVNWEQMKVLYDQARKSAGLTGKEIIVDAYCGIGTIALYIASDAKHVYGIEEVPEAIADAQYNARLNQIDATFICGLVEEELPALVKEGPIDQLILDPPRKGCHPQVIETIKEVAIPRLIYVSCNPATLARDLGLLKDDYRVEAVQPVDMFPHTAHVECVTLMSRVEK